MKHHTFMTTFFAVLITFTTAFGHTEEKLEKIVKVNREAQYQILQNASFNDSVRQSNNRHYRVSIDGGRSYGHIKTQDRFIRLRNIALNPTTLNEDAAVVEGSLYLVQLEIQPLAAMRKQIEGAGGRVVGFIPPQTYVVQATGRGELHAINALPFVGWTGPYKTAYKIAPEVANSIASDGASRAAHYMISLFSRADADVDAVVQQIQQDGGVVVKRSDVPSHFIEAELTDGQLAKILRHDNVEFVDLWTPPGSDMDIVRQASGADYVESQVPFYTGNGVAGEVLDTQLRLTHQGFAPAISHGEVVSDDGHGTRVYGILFGNGGAVGQARGMLPTGTGIFADRVFMSDRAAHVAELVDPGGEFRAVFQSNSWGHGRTTAYDTYSSQMDEIIFDNDLLITQSQSNANDLDPRSSRPEAWAKNVVAVGGVEHFNSPDFSTHAWRGIASIGPAADGRIKPDLTHFSDTIYTTGGYTNTSHTLFGGTSATTPITAGHFGLVFQMWSDGIFTGAGIPGSGTDVFASRPHSTTARALIINTARQYAFSGEEHDLTRVHQGWGVADVRSAYDSAADNGWRLPLVVNEEHPLRDQQTQKYLINVSDSGFLSWLKATMVYMDPPGSPAAEIATINDLSLRLTSPDGNVYWGNSGLLTGNWSVSGGLPTTVDTVENVFIEQATPGTWLVEVIGDRIVEDARLETQEIDADFALVITCGGQNQCVQLDNVAPEVEILFPAAGNNLNLGEEVFIEADATDLHGTITEVAFFADDLAIGTTGSTPRSVAWTPSVVGEVVLTATATDDQGATATSAGVSVEVKPGGTVCEYTSTAWPAGLMAVIRITNNSTNPVHGWQVQWEYPISVEVTDYWGAELSGANPFTATPESWNSTIQPGRSVQFGFTAETAMGENPESASVLGGETCQK